MRLQHLAFQHSLTGATLHAPWTDESWFPAFEPLLVESTRAIFKTITLFKSMSCGKVMFLHVSVILFNGGSALTQCHGTGRPPARDTVNWRAVRILIECILVNIELLPIIKIIQRLPVIPLPCCFDPCFPGCATLRILRQCDHMLL